MKADRQVRGARGPALLAFVAVLLLQAAPVFAGVGGAAVPDFPVANATVNVGDTFIGFLTLTNLSSGIPQNADDNIAATGVYFTPSCASGEGICSAPDTGVFTLSNPADAGDSNATACKDNTFTLSAPDATGEVQFVPNATIVLGPSIFGSQGLANLPGSRCKIKYTVTVLKLPAIDFDPNLPGTQTKGVARVALLQDQSTPDTSTANGSNLTNVTAPSLTIAKTPDGQVINAGATATFTIVVSNTGSGMATGAALVDPLPAGGGLSWQTSSPGCGVSGAPGAQTLSCAFGNLGPGAAVAAAVYGATSVTACTAMPNIATASATNAPNAQDQGAITCLLLSSCTYSLSPLDLSNRAAGGGLFSITVTTPAGCPVTAASFQPWVTVNNITPNGGTTTVALQIGPNAGAARATAIVVADRLYLITQFGP